jgi:hypothetical protein
LVRQAKLENVFSRRADNCRPPDSVDFRAVDLGLAISASQRLFCFGVGGVGERRDIGGPAVDERMVGEAASEAPAGVGDRQIVNLFI